MSHEGSAGQASSSTVEPTFALPSRHGRAELATANPYPYYEEIRSKGLHRGDMGVWIAARHRDAAAVFHSADIGNVASPRSPQARLLVRRILDDAPFELFVRRLFDLGGPRHGQLREALARRVSGARLQKQLSSLERSADQILSHAMGRVPQHGTVDLIEAFAFPTTAGLVLGLLQVSDEARVEYLRVIRTLAESLGPNIGPDQLGLADQNVTAGLTILDRTPLGFDLDPLDTLALSVLVYMAALEPGAYAIGNAVLTMMEIDGLREHVAGVSMPHTLVEEFLRYCAPLQIVGKTVLRDTEVNGVAVPGGSQVAVVIGAANRDPEAFHNPDEFDSGRTPNHHLTLAEGDRACIGGPLVRGLLRSVLPIVAARLPHLPADSDLRWRQSYQLRGLQHLRVVLEQGGDKS